ncbi:protein kinase domain-containing protein, partial [Noviherbaspirillum sp.]|uniref:protein kinase domain-containing protein n=1 Tax=Noviherbaspirillum sp. TaxID=1926288 RepID=UPI002FE2EC54
ACGAASFEPCRTRQFSHRFIMLNANADTEPSEVNAGTGTCLPVGSRVADFEIAGVIGEGGFGVVYLAFDHSLQRTVAIKEYMPAAFALRGRDFSVVPRSARDSETFTTGLKSFINEARLLAQFDHPALIKVYRFWEQNGTAYMAMRYYEGQTLKSVVLENPARVTQDWLKSLLKPMLEALDALYRVNILHRDISPDNIMIQASGEAVLLDFGAARQIIGDMSRSLTVILKPGYAPIEQYADDASMSQGPWTDIYSLSAVVYLAIVKKPPPTSVARMIKDPIERLQDGNFPGFDKSFLAAIDEGLAVKPEDRPQSIDAFRRMLDLELVLPMPVEPLRSAIPARNPQPPRIDSSAKSQAAQKRIKPVHAALAAGVIGLVGIGAYLGLRSIPGSPDVLAVAKQPASPTAPTPVAVVEASAPVQPPEQILDEETVAWELLQSNDDAKAGDVAGYIDKYPSGKFAPQARARLAELNRQEESAKAAKVSEPAVAAEPKPEKPTGVVRINVKPWGNVFVNGAAKGASPPLKTLTLPEGQYQIKVINPYYPPWIINVDVRKKSTSNVEHDFYRVERIE